MASREERRESRRQLGEALVLGGALALIGTPIVSGLRSAGSHVQTRTTWWWPTWWMLVPLLVLLVGLALNAIPASFDLRRSLLHSRLVSRRRERSK